MTPEPPRLTHNRTLAADYIASSGILSRYPKISEQVECLPLRLDKLQKWGYNPTIIDHDGSIFLCYRYHEGTLATKLAGARISETGEVLGSWPIEANGHSLEDPKFFKLASGELWMSWVEAYWPVKAVGSVRYGFFRGTNLNESARPQYGQNDGDHMEKGWTFFEHRDSLYFIYKSNPKQIIVRWSGQPEGEHVTEGPRWPYGEIKGGTPPIPYEGKLLRFFHATLDNEIDLPLRRYYLGACLMNPEPPFEVVAVSKKPILYGSEADNLTPDERKACKHHKAKVVFPGGVVQRDGYWLVSVGINDCSMALAKIKPAMLNL